MQDCAQSYSFSAPKVLGYCNYPIFTFNAGKVSPKVSPGTSPSCFAIKNFPIEHSGSNKNRNFFFNSEISLNELMKLADIPSIEEEDDDQVSSIKRNQYLSKSATKKPENFGSVYLQRKKIEENFVEDRETSVNKVNEPRFVPINVAQIVLKNPPLRPANVKREKRSNFDDEEISCDRFSGSLKFYNLNKRFGFIKVDDQDFDAFLCEDELILSGQNLKKFKDDVYKKIPVSFEFNIKKYLNNQVEKKKAVLIKIKNYTKDEM